MSSLYPCYFKIQDFRSAIIINIKASYAGNVGTFLSMITLRFMIKALPFGLILKDFMLR